MQEREMIMWKRAIKITIFLFLYIIVLFISPLSFSLGVHSEDFFIKQEDFLIKKTVIPLESFVSIDLFVCDLDGDKKNEIVVNNEHRGIFVYKYKSGRLIKITRSPQSCDIGDSKIIRLDGKKNYIVGLGYVAKRIWVFEYSNGKLLLRNTYKVKDLGYSIEGTGDFNGDGGEDFITGNSIFTWKNGMLEKWREYPLQEFYLCGNFAGLDRDQIASVIYKKGLKRVYRISAFANNGDARVLWKEVLPQLTDIPSGNPVQAVFDIDGDGKDDIVQRLTLKVNEKKVWVRRIICDFQKTRHGYRPKIVIARNKKLKNLVEYAFVCAYDTVDIRGNGKKMGVRLMKKTKKKKSEKYDIHNIVFCDFKNGKLIEYFCPGPSFTGKYDDLFSHQLIATGDIDNDGRDEIFVYIRKDEQQWIEVYGLNPKYY